MSIFLRPSAILKYQDCPFAYSMQYVKGWKSNETSSNLAFGTAIHSAITSWIYDDALGNVSSLAPSERFDSAWEAEISKFVINFSSRVNPTEMREIGIKLCELFPSIWRTLDLIPLFDDKGAVIERRFDAAVCDGVVLSGQPDFVGINSADEVVVLDFKTPSVSSAPVFAVQSDQLTAYQFLVESQKDQLGIARVSQVGFMELIKKKIPKNSRGEGPVVQPPKLSPRRDISAMDEFKDKVIWIAEDIQRGRFPKTPRMAWNSPCDMCEFKTYCITGDPEGLVDAKGNEIT